MHNEPWGPLGRDHRLFTSKLWMFYIVIKYYFYMSPSLPALALNIAYSMAMERLCV